MPTKHRGFTLIELLITVVIAALVLTFAVPGFQNIIRNNRRAAQVNEFVTSLNLARSEAIKASARAYVWRSTNGTTLATDSTGVWENGWVVFVDRNGDAALDAGETVQTHAALEGGARLRGPGNFGRWIAYLPSGTSLGNGGLPNDSMTFCDSRGIEEGRQIVVNFTGRTRVEDDHNNFVSVPTDACP
ncbi:MAG: GspH/FimT family pseudopilin [Gammaproteobacteria bacterium]|nr:GspH/FimT family pseudopilin [Gammaproteobacteria bacterium]MCP5423863.1 GspH/FimT family pseudopilin [Gammaproteobacteria bacterium]